MTPADQLKFMLVMAAADGGLAAEELHLLTDRAQQWGISSDEFVKIVEDAAQADLVLPFPETESERSQLLMDVIRMMGADGKLHAAEKKLFALAAAKMGIETEALNRIIDATTKTE